MACQSIAFGRGVCGTAALTQSTQLIEDVDKFPGHIACDGASKSEVVVPIIKNGKVRVYSFTSTVLRSEIDFVRLSPSSISIVQNSTGLVKKTESLWRNWRYCWLRLVIFDSDMG